MFEPVFRAGRLNPFFQGLMALCVILPGVILMSGCGVDRGTRGIGHPTPRITVKDYSIHDREGSPATLEDIILRAGDAEAVFIGEGHGDPVAHYLEKEILAALFERYGAGYPQQASKRSMFLSMEMFEKDVQIVLNEYLQDLIPERHFLASARPWPHYRRDYRPLVEFAKKQGIPVIAANAPRRYVNRVSRLGPESLEAISGAAESWLPPLPYPPASPEYRQKFMEFWRETMGVDPDSKQDSQSETKSAPKEAEKPSMSLKSEESHSNMADEPLGFENLLSAQSLWDAAMGHAAAQALIADPGALVVNINGKFHSEENLGAPEKLLHYRPGTKILTVTVHPAESFPEFDDKYRGLGDFVILTDPRLLDSNRGK